MADHCADEYLARPPFRPVRHSCANTMANPYTIIPTENTLRIAHASDFFESTDPTLLCDVKADDPAAKKRLVEWVLPLIAYWLRSSAPQDRREVIQEVFLELFEHIGNFQERTGGTFRG